jgi:hypothetical protein
MDVRSFNVTPVSHFVIFSGQNCFFQKKFQHIKMCFTEKKIFKHDEQKGLKNVTNVLQKKS